MTNLNTNVRPSPTPLTIRTSSTALWPSMQPEHFYLEAIIFGLFYRFSNFVSIDNLTIMLSFKLMSFSFFPLALLPHALIPRTLLPRALSPTYTPLTWLRSRSGVKALVNVDYANTKIILNHYISNLGEAPLSHSKCNGSRPTHAIFCLRAGLKLQPSFTAKSPLYDNDTYVRCVDIRARLQLCLHNLLSFLCLRFSTIIIRTICTNVIIKTKASRPLDM